MLARRHELMDAALQLFIEQGITATSVDQIVKSAVVAKGTFYLYFESKEGLLAALQERFITSFCTHTQRALDRHRPDQWRARLKAWVGASIECYLDQMAVHDVVFHDFHPEDREQVNANPVVAQLAAFLTAGTQADAWTVRNPHVTAIMLFSAMHGAVDDAVANDRTPDRPRLTRTVAEFFEKVLGLS